MAVSASATSTDQVVVLSADSLVFNGRPIRLLNAEAPQPVPGARCWSEAVAAKEGQRVVKEMVANASHVDVRESGQKDDGDRSLSEVRLDGLDLGETLYQSGLAVRPTGKRFDWCGPLSSNMSNGPDLLALSDLRP